jgi:hypothetical protein
MNVLTKEVGGPILPIVRYFEINFACVSARVQTGRNRRTDRQTDGLTDGRTDGQTDGKTDRRIDR